MKKNNKGFSLVELIVVVLIMAIIAVALAPQVMKWVENSRKSTDCNNYDSIVSAVNIALADEAVMKNLGTGGLTIQTTGTTTGSIWEVVAGNGADKTAFEANMKKTLGDTWASQLKIKRTTEIGSNKWTITVSSNGTVTRTYEPSSDSIS